MKRFTRLSALFCILAAASVLVACAPESFSLAGERVETGQRPQTDLEAVLDVPAALPNGVSVELEFTLINHSETALYVLKWFTPLEGLGGEIFRVKRDGQALPYEGPLAYRADPTPEAYVLLGAGESVSGKVDLATAYDFSQTGQYTIEFLSPSISHVARAEAEMAKTVADLGPVQMPSNKVAVQIGGSSDSPVRRPPAEAAEMILDHLRTQKPDLNPDVRLSVEEVPVPEAWERMQVQVFRVTGEAFARDSFLINGDRVLPLGTAFGGQGLTSMEIADLDGDGCAELLFAYSFGSGIHQSRIGMVAPAYGEDRTYEAEIVYLGDLGLFKEHLSTVGVRVVEPRDATLTLHTLDTLGYLAIERYNNQVELVLHVAEDLPDNVRQNLIQTTTAGEEGASPSEEKDLITYVNDDYGLAFIYPSDWKLAELPAGQEVPGGESATTLHLTKGTLRLTIQFKRVEEAAVLGPSGRPAGEIEERGAALVLGREIPKQVLVYEGKVKSVFLGDRFDDLELYVQLDGGVSADTAYEAIEIPESAQSAMGAILSSLTRTGGSF